ncbi:MAG: hypothetical protein WCK21_09440 [Actinomycetota bacterium]
MRDDGIAREETTMGSFHLGVPPWLVQWVKDHTEIRHAVETGTFQGESAALLAERLGQCTSIEISPMYAERARQRFADRSDITIVEGDSRRALGELCAELPAPAVFWLDGHWSGGDTGGGAAPCPVLEEIDAIIAAGRSGDVIVVDDARLFGIGHDLDPDMQHYPRLITLLSHLEAAGGITYVLDDVVVCVPPELSRSFMMVHADPHLRQRLILATMWPDIERLGPPRRDARRLLAAIRRRLRSRLTP